MMLKALTPDMTDAALANEPMLSALANEPIDPILRADPTEPILSTEFFEPIESKDPCEAILHFESVLRKELVVHFLVMYRTVVPKNFGESVADFTVESYSAES